MLTGGRTASEKCQQEKRKTVNGEDILFAMTSLGFENYAEALKIYLARYREVSCLFHFPPSRPSPKKLCHVLSSSSITHYKTHTELLVLIGATRPSSQARNPPGEPHLGASGTQMPPPPTPGSQATPF